MVIPNPKFEKHINSNIRSHESTRPTSRYGVIAEYDGVTNTAKVILSSPDSHAVGDIIVGVACPVYPGIQIAAPEPGRPCWVVFSGTNDSSPVISHYFNHNFQREYYRHTDATHDISRFIVSM